MREKSKKFTGVYREVLKDGDISYYYTYKDNDNKLNWIKVGKKSEDIREIDAHHRRLDTLNLQRNGELPEFIKKKQKIKQITLNEVADEYFKYLKLKDKTPKKRNTKETYGKYINRIEPYFGKSAVKEISKIEFEKYLYGLKAKNLADATINNYHSIIKSIINYGINHFIELDNVSNVASKVRLIKLDNNRQRILSLKELEMALESLKGNMRNYLFFSLLMQTGARPIAILQLKKIDISLDDKVLRVRGLKKGMTYQTFISESLYKILKERLEKLQNEHYIFHCTRPELNYNKPIEYETLRRQIQPKLDRLFNQGVDSSDRINKVTFYTLRHTFATHMAQNPAISVFDLKNLMGHNTLRMTERYAKSKLQDTTKAAINQMFKF